MVNGRCSLPFTIYHSPFTKLLLLVLVLLLRRGGGLLAGRLPLVLVEQGLDDLLVVVGGLDVGLLAERAQVVFAPLVGAFLRHDAADEVLLEGVVALVDAQDDVALVGLNPRGDASGLQVFDRVGG